MEPCAADEELIVPSIFAPQAAQKVASSGLGAPHFEQYIVKLGLDQVALTHPEKPYQGDESSKMGTLRWLNNVPSLL